MKLPRLLRIVLGVLAAVVVALAVFIRGGAGSVCPAVGHAYTGDAELVFAHEPTSVSACFGEGCTPAPLTKTRDNRWLVPQSSPYLVPPVSVTSVSVAAVDSSGVRMAHVLPIETEPTGEHPDGPGCGGPVRFKPVQVPGAMPGT
ncbi:hypothetical protein GCM10027405_20610 [Arthrobacter alkaliphilus]|uniref:hypothetical protein n=1 Tax=Arthrobacter alkaliphilus TaxID=369936 RepID=UPI001F3515C3|nr:hypothetical protein [Arthrobacter alkaliphilus]